MTDKSEEEILSNKSNESIKSISSKEENISIKLQLGDILQIDSPTNEDLNNKIFFIKFINLNKIVLVNNEKTITLEINESGKLVEESIDNILLLNRHYSPSFVIQNNLDINKYISIYFGGELPKIVNGIVTNIENDMIELTTVPDKDIIYIDFAYQGIPEELNIEKIIVKDKLDSIKSQEKDDDSEKKDSEKIEEVQDIDGDYRINSQKEEVDEILLDSLNIGNDLNDIEYTVNVDEDEQRYSLDKQVNDYLDKLINNYLPEERTDSIINNINHEINRFKELRKIYSRVDKNLNLEMIELNDEYYKPVKETIMKLNKKLYWILPLTQNIKKVIKEEEDETDNDYLETIKIGSLIEELNKISLNWMSNSSKEKINNYKDYINNLIKLFENYENNYEDNIEVNDSIHVINNILDDYYQYVIKDGSIEKSKFMIDVYSTGLNMIETYYDNNKKIPHQVKLTNNDYINILSFITLPLPIINFSLINLDYTNIYERCNLNINYLKYSQILNDRSNINRYIIDQSIGEEFLDTHNTINSEFMDNINNYIFTGDNDLNYLEKLNLLIETFIPTKSETIKKITENMLKNNKADFLSIEKILYYLQPYFIDFYNINLNDYNVAKEIVDKNILNHEERLKKMKDELIKYISLLNDKIKDEDKSNTQYLFNLLNEELKTDLLTTYDIKEDIFNSTDELISYLIVIDNCEFFLQAVNKNIMDLIVGNLLENFIKAKEENKLDEEIEKIKEEDKCRTYLISKKYTSQIELDNDNSKKIFFDPIYDNTFYNLLNTFSKEREEMSDKDFYNLIKIKIIELEKLDEEAAAREAEAVVNGKREVKNGDYCILEDKETNKNYVYKRVEDKWVIDEEFMNNFYINSNKILCDSKKECITKDDKCMTTDQLKKEKSKEDLDKILDSFKSTYSLSIEEIKGKVNNEYENNKNKLQKILKINEDNLNYQNKFLVKYDIQHEENKLESPYSKIIDKILSLKDLPQKYELVKRFSLMFTRENILEESPYWLYCNKTNLKLLPKFILRLANVFLNKLNYVRELDLICAEQGTISDDNNYWVDKHSGYIIRNIDFDTEESYDDKGYKMLSRDILENEYEININDKDQKMDDNTKMIKNIIKAIEYHAGINIDNYYEYIINSSMTLQKKLIPSKEQFEKMMEKKAKKDGKVKDKKEYEETYNFSLLTIVLSYIVFSIQISIPNIKSKKTFPGCIKSFKGYPLTGEEDLTNINYIACISSKIKSSIKPWNTILKTSESSIVKKITIIIRDYILQIKENDEKLREKLLYLSQKNVEDIPEELSVNSWKTFMPPLFKFSINSDKILPVSDTFKDTVYTTIKRSKENKLYEMLQSKIYYLSNSIIESINNTVVKNTPLLQNQNGEPYLENACCNGLNNTIEYFTKNDSTIKDKNLLVNYYNKYLESFKDLRYSPSVIHAINTKRPLQKIPISYNEEIIYKAFIHFCNFTNNIEISEELKEICLDKPKDIDFNKDIKEIIDSLKSQGKIYNFE